MLKHWLTATVVGLLICLALIFNYWGIGVSFVTIGVIYLVYSYKKSNHLPIDRRFYLISGYSILLSGMFFVTTVATVRFFGGLFLFLLLITLGYCETKWRWTLWLGKGFIYVSNYLTYYTEYFKRKHKLDDKTISIAGQAIIGLLIALPILSVATFLLSSADAVFSNGVSDFTQDIGEFLETVAFEGMEKWIFRLIIFVLVTPTMYGSWYYFAKLSREKMNKTGILERDRKEPVEIIADEVNENTAAELIDSTTEMSDTTRFVTPIVTATVLTSLNIIYLLFAYIQIRFLFMGGSSGLEGYEYAGYAREGFFELVFLSLLNTMGILFINRFSKPHRFNRISLTVMVVCTFIMMASSYYKMYLYEMTYGYTQLRLYVYLILAYMFVFMSLIMVNVWRHEFKVIEIAMVVGLVYFLVVSYVNIDTIIVENNLHRYEETGELDIYYLTTLSEDCAPVLVPFIEDHEELITSGVASRYAYYKSIITDDTNRSLLSYNIRRQAAVSALE